MFYLNTRIPLVRSGSELVVHCTWKAPEGVRCPAILAMHESTIHPQASSSSAQLEPKNKDPYTQPSEPILFPEVTGIVCRRPLAMLFNEPVAANLGGLMRVMGTSRGVNKYYFLSRTFESAPGTSEDKVRYPLINPTSRQSDFIARRN